VPPETVPNVSEPLLEPQVAPFVLTAIAVGPLLFEMLAVVEKVHPLASFTSMVYEPAARLLYTNVDVNALPFTE